MKIASSILAIAIALLGVTLATSRLASAQVVLICLPNEQGNDNCQIDDDTQ
jgi:hypothetical protein